jgi:hypothetical protein
MINNYICDWGVRERGADAGWGGYASGFPASPSSFVFNLCFSYNSDFAEASQDK